MTKIRFTLLLTRPTVGQDSQKCKETSNLDVIVTDTSSPLGDKQQKMGEHAENIEQLNLMFSTC